MPKLENKKISNVYEGKGGTTNQKNWKWYDFKLEGGTFKYSFLWGDGRRVPQVGDIVSFDFTPEEKDGYTNNKTTKIDTIVKATGEHHNPPPASQNGGQGAKSDADMKDDIWKLGRSIVSCIEISLKYAPPEAPPEDILALFDMCMGFLERGRNRLTGNVSPEHKNLSEPVRDDEPPRSFLDDDIPF